MPLGGNQVPGQLKRADSFLDLKGKNVLYSIRFYLCQQAVFHRATVASSSLEHLGGQGPCWGETEEGWRGVQSVCMDACVYVYWFCVSFPT